MEKSKESGAWRPNVVVMILAVMTITVVTMIAVDEPKDALPLATAAVGGFAGSGSRSSSPTTSPRTSPTRT